jgi:hypothetical protein
VVLATFGFLSLADLWFYLIRPNEPRNTSGPFAIIAVASLFVSFAMTRAAVRGPRDTRPIRPQMLSAFGLGWLTGVGLVMVGLVVRSFPNTPFRLDVGSAVIELISSATVLLIMSIPGLWALSAAKRTNRPL